IPVQEGFRRSLQHALQWFDVLYARVQIQATKVHGSHGQKDNADPWTIWQDAAQAVGLTQQSGPHAHPRLVSRCPACLELLPEHWGGSFKDGGNIHGAVDGNFTLRHNSRSGDCPDINYTMQCMLPKSFVDAVGRAHDIAAKRTRRTYAQVVPDVVIDECESSHTAADGSKGKATSNVHDDKGVMAFVCRHDIPWFACNIDTPGEQQKYALSLILAVLLHLPPSATMAVLYDIGCVTSRVVQVHDILMPGMRERLVFATSAMHAYVHQWSCQLGFNPRLQPGFGLTDGEGVERLWSRLRDLISILRCVSRLRRLVILDQQMFWVGEEMRDNLGRWDAKRTKLVKRRRDEAMAELRLSGFTLADVTTAPDGAIPLIRHQWELQRTAQLSVRSMTKPRMKHELQTVMRIQDDIAKVEDDIDAAEEILGRGPSSADARRIRAQLRELHVHQQTLRLAADALYDALNFEETLPHYRQYSPRFVRLLIEAYDAKCITRHKLIGRFFEWDRLNRAVGGIYAPVGTKDHQRGLGNLDRTRKSTLKCLARYNDLCEQIANLAPGDDIALPQPLDTNLATLRDSPALLEDVWIGGPRPATDRWLTDANVHVAIRAMHQLDRCREEEVRLLRERDNLSRWVIQEWDAISQVMRDENYRLLLPLLRAQHVRLEDLASGMRNFAGFPQEQRRADPAHVDQDGPVPPTAERPDTDIPTAFRDTLPHDFDDEAKALLVEEALDGGDDDAPASGFVDTNLLATLERDYPTEPSTTLDVRFRHGNSTLTSVNLQSRGQRMLIKGYMVNEDVVWASMVAFQLAFPRHMKSLALFSTYPYEQWLDGMQARDIFRGCKTSHFWLARRILIPVYDRDGLHWMAAVVRPAIARIDMYDSYAKPRICEQHGRLVGRLVTALLDYVLADGIADIPEPPRTWVVVMGISNAVQVNGVDCGLWTAANFAAIMRGYRVTGLQEADMTRFRQLTYGVVCRHIPLREGNRCANKKCMSNCKLTYYSAEPQPDK
ncbi:hypothetical protein BKA62DRAFT_623799, partial [Auriculariales sp. MPI-PUGE-AT-0066]